MQHLDTFSGSPIMTIFPIAFIQFFIAGAFSFFKGLRAKEKEKRKKAGRAGLRAALFDEEVIDSENDIMCLCGSYMMVTSLRFLLVGEIPNMLGEIEGDQSWGCVYSLYALGLFLSMLSILFIVGLAKLMPPAGGEEAEEEEEESVLVRFIKVLIGMNGMAFAWCCLFASRTVCTKSEYLEQHAAGMETIMGRVLLALILSMISTAIIFGLDVIGDTAKIVATSPQMKNLGPDIITQLVSAKSILVGFSWEHAFDGGVEAIASTTSNPQCAEVVIAALVFVVIVPAWRRHILQKAMVLQERYAAEMRNDSADPDYTRLKNEAK